MGAIFNFFVHTFLIKDIKDTQCGFKMFRREIIRPLWENIRLQGFGFDLEVLFLAQKMNYRIKEVAVNWTHKEQQQNPSGERLLDDAGQYFSNQKMVWLDFL